MSIKQASINRAFLGESTPFLLPPEAEQRRIVSKIESLQERSSRARRALSEVGPLLEQFRQSVLAAAFRGDLTADWREAHPDVEPATKLLERIRSERRHRWEQSELAKYEANGKQPPKGWQDKCKVETELDLTGLPQLPEGWQYARADEIVEPGTIITYGIVLPGPHIDDGVPYIRGQDIENGRILIDQLLRTTSEIDAKHSRSSVASGDVLLCVIRHLKVALVPDGIDGVNLTQGTVRMRPSSIIDGSFLTQYLGGPLGQEWMKRRHFGLAMPRINVADARAVPVPIAPHEEQTEIVRQIDAAMLSWERITTETRMAVADLAQLDQSILAKAFRGELVPQDPNDEPASVLLERIRRERETNGAKKTKPKRKAKK
ncbi:MAG: restriction endonuclease subunit S [Planctomycetota bacterium]|nr:restriction endonuclease subunit S [Planctomycetota bacterium]